jgi:phosphatidylglycerol:prolipoprotein diacylglycerol transferase
MYPNIYYLIYDLFGIEIPVLKIVQSFGFFVAMAFVAASYALSKELERKTKNGLLKPTFSDEVIGEKASIQELLFTSAYGFILGFKLSLFATDFDKVINDPQGTLLSIEGNLLAGIIIAGVFAFYTYRKKEKERLPEPRIEKIETEPKYHVGNITVIAAVSGIVGAKIFHLLENPDEIALMFKSANSFFSGLTMYGGLIFGAASVLFYGHKKGINPKHLIDAAGPSIMIGYAIGRVGCHVSGDGDWGVANLATKPNWMSFLPDWMWSYNYPNNVIGVYGPQQGGSHGVQITSGPCWDGFCTELSPSVFPTAFYEAVMCIGLFFVLWSIRKRITTPGVLFSIYLILNGLERFFIEKIRVNEKLWGLDITQAEVISSCLVVLGIIGIFVFKKLDNNNEPSTSL